MKTKKRKSAREIAEKWGQEFSDYKCKSYPCYPNQVWPFIHKAILEDRRQRRGKRK